MVYPPETPSLEELGRVLAENGVNTLWLTAGLFHRWWTSIWKGWGRYGSYWREAMCCRRGM